jgi:hypothetical protein
MRFNITPSRNVGRGKSGIQIDTLRAAATLRKTFWVPVCPV